jgi:hypothetical protein
MSTTAAGGNPGGQGGRNTGASGGPYNMFLCRNVGQPGHPKDAWVATNQAECAHCQVSQRGVLYAPQALKYASVRSVRNDDFEEEQIRCPFSIIDPHI